MKWEAIFHWHCYWDSGSPGYYVPMSLAERFGRRVLIQAIEGWLRGGDAGI